MQNAGLLGHQVLWWCVDATEVPINISAAWPRSHRNPRAGSRDLQQRSISVTSCGWGGHVQCCWKALGLEEPFLVLRTLGIQIHLCFSTSPPPPHPKSDEFFVFHEFFQALWSWKKKHHQPYCLRGSIAAKTAWLWKLLKRKVFNWGGSQFQRGT